MSTYMRGFRAWVSIPEESFPLSSEVHFNCTAIQHEDNEEVIIASVQDHGTSLLVTGVVKTKEK